MTACKKYKRLISFIRQRSALTWSSNPEVHIRALTVQYGAKLVKGKVIPVIIPPWCIKEALSCCNCRETLHVLPVLPKRLLANEKMTRCTYRGPVRQFLQRRADSAQDWLSRAVSRCVVQPPSTSPTPHCFSNHRPHRNHLTASQTTFHIAASSPLLRRNLPSDFAPSVLQNTGRKLRPQCR